MEISMQERYLNSQDQVIISLNSQIEAMLPLKESFEALKRYQLKLTHDCEVVATENVLLLLFRVMLTLPMRLKITNSLSLLRNWMPKNCLTLRSLEISRIKEKNS